jgi:cytoskeletal protein RodZ
MQSVGTRLREARIKKGYTLEDINARTRISLKNLTAIESDDLSKISSPFTYRSFVKQIADTVGVDSTTVASDALAASTTMPEVLVPGQEEEVVPRPHQFQQVKPKANWNWARTASIAAVAGAVSVYLIWRNGGIEAAKLPASVFPASSQTIAPATSDRPESVVSQPSQAEPATVSVPMIVPVVSKSQQPATQAPEPPPPGTEQLLPPASAPVHPNASTVSQTATSQEPEGGAIHIELSAIEPTWLAISSDGKTTYSGTLAAMQTKTFDGKDSAQIRTANAGGVNIIFNGRALGPLGRRGQSRTFVFTKSGYEVVQGLTMAHLSPTGQ